MEALMVEGVVVGAVVMGAVVVEAVVVETVMVEAVRPYWDIWHQLISLERVFASTLVFHVVVDGGV